MRVRSMSVLAVLLVVLALAIPAGADHTDPRVAQAPTTGHPAAGAVTRGAGTWTHIAGFHANPGSYQSLSGGSTDVKVFAQKGNLYASIGTLGQAQQNHVGQRIIQLTNGQNVQPTWVADHGSAKCQASSSVTSLQHDAAIASRKGVKILIDTTDATSRCHDTPGGGLELVDVSRLWDGSFAPREIHLTRHNGTTHTVTVDATRPWVVYNSTSEFGGKPWIDVLDVRTCLRTGTLATKRKECRPRVYRIKFQPEWSQARDSNTGDLKPGTEASCHDITVTPGRLYCAGLNATLIFDVTGLTDATGNIKGTRLPCSVVNGTATGAKVTDCSGQGAAATQQAAGWTFLGSFNHPGRDCGGGQTSCNSNLIVPSDEGVAISHESDPTPDGQHMFVTDERGGGIVPPGASCEPGVDNPYGNGGIHVFDISDPANIEYALTPSGDKAVFRSTPIVASPSFCDVHVIEQVPGEQRIVAAYYTQGTKIVDYQVDANGRWTFTEVAGVVFPQANTWAVTMFKTKDNADGTRTYYFVASDIGRGIDVFSWTGPKGPALGATAAPSSGSAPTADMALAGLLLVLLPAARVAGRRRRA